MKKIIALLLTLVMFGCSSKKIMFYKTSLKDNIDNMNQSEKIIAIDGEQVFSIQSISDEYFTNVVEESNVNITNKNEILNLQGTGKNNRIYNLEFYQENDQYYIVSYAYEQKSDPNIIYAPLGYDEETIYLIDEASFKQFYESIQNK